MKIVLGIFLQPDEPEEEQDGITEQDIADLESILVDNGVEEG